MNHHWNNNIVIDNTFIRLILERPKSANQVCLRRWNAECELMNNPESGYWKFVNKVINNNHAFNVKKDNLQYLMPIITYYGLENTKVTAY